VGIQTQMLERGLNGIRMSPVPADVRQLMFKVKKKQGTDISRSFDGLNNPQNLELSFKYAKEGGMIAQGALSLTYSPLHNVNYYINLAEQYIALGAQEICIKDMAGIGRPSSVGKIVKGIKASHPDILVQYHGHSTPGFSVASSLEAARNGADIIDVGMEPLSWGTGHADLLTIHEMLKDDGFSLPEINMKAYMQVRSLSQEFIDDFLGMYINKQNRFMNSLLIGPGLPGGMMGSLMADLENNLKSINKWLTKNNKENLTQEELLIRLFDEVKLIWPQMGYPPLVTPFSQYVKNAALMNISQMIKGRERWSMLDENTWGMLMGKSGKLLGPIDPTLKNLASEQGREYFTGKPQDLYPNELDLYREKMKEKGWEEGQDQEELMEYAMHPSQYEAFKSGKAKEGFLKDLDERRQKASAVSQSGATIANLPNQVEVNVDGNNYLVKIKYPDVPAKDKKDYAQDDILKSKISPNSVGTYIDSPLEGKFFLTKDSSEKPIKVGDVVEKGQTVAYIEAMKVINAITADKAGTVTEIFFQSGDSIDEDDHILKLN